MRKTFYVYILASGRNGTLYIGVTNDLVRRITEHRDEVNESFTKRYGVKRLVYFEEYSNPSDAIAAEKRLKAWKRRWKLDLIEEFNPDWVDLYDDIVSSPAY